MPTGAFLPHHSVAHVYAGVEPSHTDASSLDAGVRTAVQDALLAGAGATWRARHAVRYNPYAAAEGKGGEAAPAAQ